MKGYEKWFNDRIAFYIVWLGLRSFKVGITLGIDNALYLGVLVIGIDIDLYR